MVEMQSQHFAFGEFGIAKAGFNKAGHAYIAANKLAIDKDMPRKIAFGKVAVAEGTSLIFQRWQGGFAVIDLVEGFVGQEVFFHGRCTWCSFDGLKLLNLRHKSNWSCRKISVLPV